MSAEGAEPIMHHLQTVRTGRYYTIGASPSRTKRVWFVLHGYGQLAQRMLRHFEGAVPDDTMIVAPEGLSRFYLEAPRADGGHLARVGATWLTREDREVEIEDSHAWLTSVRTEVLNQIVGATYHEPTVAVLAFSQGVATAMRWIATGRARPKQFVMWAGGLAQDVDQDAMRASLANVEVVLVAGEHDQFATPDVRARLETKVRALAENVRVVLFDGAHQLDSHIIGQLMNELATG